VRKDTTTCSQITQKSPSDKWHSTWKTQPGVMTMRYPPIDSLLGARIVILLGPLPKGPVVEAKNSRLPGQGGWQHIKGCSARVERKNGLATRGVYVVIAFALLKTTHSLGTKPPGTAVKSVAGDSLREGGKRGTSPCCWCQWTAQSLSSLERLWHRDPGHGLNRA
jgi:hypothetical protein